MPAVSRTYALAPNRKGVARNVLIPPPILEGNAGRVCPGNGVSVLGLWRVFDPEGTGIVRENRETAAAWETGGSWSGCWRGEEAQ